MLHGLTRLLPGLIGLTSTVGLIVIGVSIPDSREQVVTALAGMGGGYFGFLQRDRQDDSFQVARQDSGTIVVENQHSP